MRTTKTQTFLLVTLLVYFALSTGTAFAATASGTIAVTATIAGSMNMVFNSDASGIALGGSGTSAATIAFGTVSAYGGVIPAGVTRTVIAGTSWSLSTPFDVQVFAANLPASANYTLTAQLNVADAVNTWQIGASTITAAAPSTLTSTGAYSTNTAYTFKLTFPWTEAAGAVSNTLNFVATSN